MDRFAILVDAGYFYAAGAFAVTATKISRRNITLPSPQSTIKALSEIGAKQAGAAALLRVYWYDAMTKPRLSMEQSAIANLAGVKVRLGSVNNVGEQKGVDSLIVTDLIELARNRAISDAILVAGDEDLRIAVQLAQTYGVRVHLLAVGDADKNVSPALRMEADSLEMLDVAWIKQQLDFSAVVPFTPTMVAGPKGYPSLSLEDAANSVCEEILGETEDSHLINLSGHIEVNKTIPPEFDRRFIAKTSGLMVRRLSSDELRKIRGLFVVALRAKIAGLAAA